MSLKQPSSAVLGPSVWQRPNAPKTRYDIGRWAPLGLNWIAFVFSFVIFNGMFREICWERWDDSWEAGQTKRVEQLKAPVAREWSPLRLAAIRKAPRSHWWKLATVSIWLSSQLLNLLPDKAEGIASLFPSLEKSVWSWAGLELSRVEAWMLFKRSVSSCLCGLWNSDNSLAAAPFRLRPRSMSLYPEAVPGEPVQIRLQLWIRQPSFLGICKFRQPSRPIHLMLDNKSGNTIPSYGSKHIIWEISFFWIHTLVSMTIRLACIYSK